MYFPPFVGQYFRSDIHDGIYRCQASNQAGTIISREVYVRGGKFLPCPFTCMNTHTHTHTHNTSEIIHFGFIAVVRQPYNVKIEGREVFLGNSAFLRCTISNHVQEFVKVISWHFGEEIMLQERSDIGEYVFLKFNSISTANECRNENEFKYRLRLRWAAHRVRVPLVLCCKPTRKWAGYPRNLNLHKKNNNIIMLTAVPIFKLC